MTVNVNEKSAKLKPARRRKIEARARVLIAEEMTMREVRKARRLTQARLAKKLGVTQDGISRLEKRSDLLLSTLRKAVHAMGGNLQLVAEFPDRPPVLLAGFSGNPDTPGVPRQVRNGVALLPRRKASTRVTTKLIHRIEEELP